MGPTAIISALLHDVVEDTEVTLEEIEAIFGPTVGKIVDGLTKLDGTYHQDTLQAENFKKVLGTLVDDVRVILIKMADRLHNMRTLGAMPREKQLKIASETSYIYAPLAHRLGLYNIKTEFQDLCMHITEPETYEEIERKLIDSEDGRMVYIDNFIEPLREHLDNLKFPYRITGRPKSVYSIWNKIKTKHVEFEEIYDLFAIRIVIDVKGKLGRVDKMLESSLCWQIYNIVSQIYRPIPERLKDWVSTPKSNGYESLHTSVMGPDGRFVEVQIRSERMDEIAECGFAAHWKYKGVKGQEDTYKKWLDSMRELLENKDADPFEILQDVKTNLFHDEVYVYTPAGDLITLPKGASALDFAFSIHTDVGYHCKSALVNNKIVPLGHPLENGDQVKINTHSNQKPNESWLKLVKTGKARSKIRQAVREERNAQAEIGKETLERKLRNMKVGFEENVDMLVKHFGYRARLDFFYAISTDHVNLQELKNFKTEGLKLIEEKKKELGKKTLKPKPQPIDPNRTPRLLINGEPAESLDYSLAPCCNPVFGDDVFAYITTQDGLKIHRHNCPNARDLLSRYGYRVMKAEWTDAPLASFEVDLLITGFDDGPGVIERLSQKISSDLGLNIRSFFIEGKEGIFEGKVKLVVNHKNQISHAVEALKSLREVASVRRME